MEKYYLNTNTSTNPHYNREVHRASCPLLKNADWSKYVDLGYHSSCQAAITEARNRGYQKVDGCKTCSPECHKG